LRPAVRASRASITRRASSLRVRVTCTRQELSRRQRRSSAVDQSQVSEDDPFAQLRVSGALVVEEPLLDLLDGALVTGADP
jgi:hypothetical protein